MTLKQDNGPRLERGLSQPLLALAAQNLLVDRLAAEVTGVLDSAGIDSVLVKGPVIGEWLYEDGVRGYGDADLMISPKDWEEAIGLLLQNGFRDYLAPLAHPGLESSASKGLARGSDNVDLHRTLAGLEAPPDEVWRAISSEAGRQRVGGRQIAVPSRPAVLMHLALHAAAHYDAEKPLEDLRRGIAAGSEAQWRAAAELAARLDGLAAFASGLRRLPEGAALGAALAVGRAGSLRLDLRHSGVPTAVGLHELLGPGLTLPERCRLLLHELFPNPAFMRWWSGLARRGTRGLIASYPLRWIWLSVNVPAGLLELVRAWRRRAGR